MSDQKTGKKDLSGRARAGVPGFGKEVLLLGVKGSGKTVMLSVLGKRFEKEGPLGLCLVPEAGTATDDFVTEVSLRLAEGRFPAATGRSERMLLRWRVRSGSRDLFSLGSMDCAGETILDAFCGTGDADGAEAPDLEQDDLVGTRTGRARGRSERDVVETLRAMANRAAAICLVLNPNDFPSNVRRSVQGDPAQKRDFEERFKAMRRLSLAVAQNPAFADKTLFVVLTQVGDEAIRAGIESTGDPAGYLEAEFPALLRSAPAAKCLAVSAVNEVEEAEDPATGRVVASPMPGFTSTGLVEFLVRVGGELAPALAPVRGAWDAYRAAERVDSLVRASVRSSAEGRLAAAVRRHDAAAALAAACKSFLASDPSNPDPLGRTEEETRPFVAAAKARLDAERALDEWIRARAVAAASGKAKTEPSRPAWRSAAAEALDFVNGKAASGDDTDGGFSGDRFWGAATPEWLQAEVEKASARMGEDFAALEEALSGRDDNAAAALAGKCAAAWPGAPGLDALAARCRALCAERDAERKAEVEAKLRAAKAAERARRRRRRAEFAVAAFLFASALSCGWYFVREKTLSDYRQTWAEAVAASREGRFSAAAALSRKIVDLDALLVSRGDIVDEAVERGWLSVPGEYSSIVSGALSANKNLNDMASRFVSGFAKEDMSGPAAMEFARAVSVANGAVPGPALVDSGNLPLHGVAPAAAAAAFTNMTSLANRAARMLPRAEEEARKRRDDRIAREDAIRAAASNAVDSLRLDADSLASGFAPSDLESAAASLFFSRRDAVVSLLADAGRTGSLDVYRKIPAEAAEARKLLDAAAGEASRARLARQERERAAKEAELKGLVEAVREAVAGGSRFEMPGDVAADNRAPLFAAWREALFARPGMGPAGPDDPETLEKAWPLVENYLAAAGVDPADEASDDPVAARARAWAVAWADKAENAGRAAADRKASPPDRGWLKALECEKWLALVAIDRCAPYSARRRVGHILGDLPAYLVVGAVHDGKAVGIADRVLSPSNAGKVKDPATGLEVAVAPLEPGSIPLLRFKRHNGGAPVEGVPRLANGTNRFNVVFD